MRRFGLAYLSSGVLVDLIDLYVYTWFEVLSGNSKEV